MSKVFDIATLKYAVQGNKERSVIFIILSLSLFILFLYALFWRQTIKSIKVDTVALTPNITVPCVSGNNQYGSARFTTESEREKHFTKNILDFRDEFLNELIKKGKEDYSNISKGIVSKSDVIEISSPTNIFAGIPIEYKRQSAHKELIRLIYGDVHTITFGTTRCGKSRTLVLQSICFDALADSDILCSDPKGELYQYTYPFLDRLGYKRYAIDFKNPCKSAHINFLQFIINALNNNDISKAIQCSWDFVDSIVAEPKTGEPLWANGEKALLTAGVLQVVYDNSIMGLKQQYQSAKEDELIELYNIEHKEYQNCSNLYNYISRMTETNKETGRMYLEDMIDILDDDHPSKMIMRVAESAPPKMRGSFITSALTTLRLFTDPNIAELSRFTDEGLLELDDKKAIFLIVPDTKKTYYSLVSIFVNQYYQYISDFADSLGGRLPRNLEVNLDEFGNFTKIPEFETKLTVGAGRGIHFNLYVQSQEQLLAIYGKEVTNIILENCHYLIYLKSGSSTAKMFEESLGKYTVNSVSSSASLNNSTIFTSGINNSGSSSSSTQLVGRSLLTSDEIKKIERPYILVYSDNGFPSLTQSPDLSKWKFNVMLGLGNTKHNQMVRKIRENVRPTHEISKILLWDFSLYINNKINIMKDTACGEDFLKGVAENFDY